MIMSNLAEKTCIPCSGDLPAMTEPQAQAYMDRIEGWELAEHGTWLKRAYTFKNWKQAYAFLAHIDAIAEAEMHHPDVTFGWGYVNVALQTHKIGGLHENDFIVAARIEKAFVAL
jgi:4a-hydroxytetrahydrobiopterin dehydratase